ncbi:hypothetical protein [Sphingomonas sp. 3-13AW]|uniref:hypothetical protein n=1 Tax=Sphingomonas sp. 3-13AW TaxID=3050450 RepID=UPI003BB55D5D
MPSPIKKTGRTGSLLTAMAKRGGSMTADYRGFPPSRIFLPLRRRGLVELSREGAYSTHRYNIWRLTQKGWDAAGMKPPAAGESLAG